MNRFDGEQFHQQILNSMQYAVIARDSKGTITFWNRYATSILGWESAEIVGKSMRVILADDEVGDKHLALLLSLPMDSSQSSEVLLRRKNGNAIAVHVTASLIGPHEGNPTGSVYVIVPVSDRIDEETTTGKNNTEVFLGNGAESAGDGVNRDLTDPQSAGVLLLRRVLDTLPIGVSVAGKDGHIVLSNPAAQRIWINNIPQVLGLPVVPEDGALARAIQNGAVTLNETVEINTPDGGRKTILSSAAPIRNPQAQIIGGIAVHQDITEQRRLEEAERKHRTFVNALNNITASLTSSLDLQTVMEKILDNVGRVVPHEAANIMLIEGDRVRVAFWRNYGPKCDEIFRVNRYRLDIPMLAHMLNTGLPQLMSDIRNTPEWVMFEETAWIRSSVGVPIRARDVILGFLILDSSEPEYFRPPDAERLRAFAYQAAIAIENARLFSTVQDYATELEVRVAERTAELRAAKDHVEAILEHSSDGFALTNEAGVITQVNPSFGQLFGIIEIEPESPTLFALVHPNGHERLREAFQYALTQEKAYRLELTCYRIDGSPFDADVAIAPLFDATKETYICNVRDITQHKTAERELRTALEQEKQLGELKSRFVAIVSHEFRTPLAVIQTSSDLLYRYSDRITTERRNEIIMRIQSQIQQLIALLEDTIIVAKADTFGLVVDLEIVDLKTLCTEVISYMSDSITQNRAIILHSPDNPLSIELDTNVMRQALINLLSNAIKYSYEDSQIDLIIHATETQAMIEIHDHGIGIPEEDLSGLFDPFYRAHNVSGRPGTGLGLAVVKRAVEAHHGTIAVVSEPGVSTRFILTIPKSQPHPA